MSLGFYTGKVIFVLFIIWSLLLFLEFIFCLSLADIGTWKMATKVDHNPEWQEPEATEDWDNGINFGTLWSQTFMNFKLVEYPYPFVLKAFAILAFKSVFISFSYIKNVRVRSSKLGILGKGGNFLENSAIAGYIYWNLWLWWHYHLLIKAGISHFFDNVLDTKKSFLLRISSGNVIKSLENHWFGHIYWKKPEGLIQKIKFVGEIYLKFPELFFLIW